MLKLLLFGLLIGLAAAPGRAAEAADPARFLPDDAAGWPRVGRDQEFDRAAIFKFMDGAGEIYLSYGFTRLLVREYGLSGKPPVAVEVYDMGTPADAFGIFSQDSDGMRVEVGEDGLSGGGLLRFWKGRWFVRILAESDTPETAAVVNALAARVSAAIPRSGARPRLLDLLPGEGLDRRETRYLHKQVALNAHYYIADENVLAMSASTEAALATYRRGDQKQLLLLVRYPSGEEAARAFRRFGQSFFYEKVDYASGRHVEEIDEGNVTGAARRGPYLVLALDAPDRAVAESLLAAVERRIREAKR